MFKKEALPWSWPSLVLNKRKCFGLAFLSRELAWHRNICGWLINHRRWAEFITGNVITQGLRSQRNFEIQETKPNSSTQRVGDFNPWLPEYQGASSLQTDVFSNNKLFGTLKWLWLPKCVWFPFSLSNPVLNLLKHKRAYLEARRWGKIQSQVSLFPLRTSAKLTTYYSWKLAALKGERLPEIWEIIMQ